MSIKRECSTCKHFQTAYSENPCNACLEANIVELPGWEPAPHLAQACTGNVQCEAAFHNIGCPVGPSIIPLRAPNLQAPSPQPQEAQPHSVGDEPTLQETQIALATEIKQKTKELSALLEKAAKFNVECRFDLEITRGARTSVDKTTLGVRTYIYT